MLVSAKEMLNKAREGKYAVGQFNINNLEWTKAVLLTAQENNSPVILGVSEGAGKYMGGYKTIVGMVNGMLEELNITVPVALHLDHGSYEGALKVIEAGFSSVMFDGSHYSIEENIAKTKEIVEIAHAKGISVEAEVGSIGGEEDGVVGTGEVADPAECKLISDLGLDKVLALELSEYKIRELANAYIRVPEDFRDKFINETTQNLSDKELREFYKKIKSDNSFWENIFSIRNLKQRGKKVKVVTLFGLQYRLSKDEGGKRCYK